MEEMLRGRRDRENNRREEKRVIIVHKSESGEKNGTYSKCEKGGRKRLKNTELGIHLTGDPSSLWNPDARANAATCSLLAARENCRENVSCR